MDRHKDWATIVCLIGGGQEINKGESAGLSGWFEALKSKFPDWDIYISDKITEDEYSKLSRIINDDTESNDSKKEFSDCIKIINQEYENKNSSSPSDMSDDEFRNLFSKIDK